MSSASWIFWLAGAYGIVVLVPQYFLLEKISRDVPPAITHPEYFYGFIGVAVAWQVAFLVIGFDPPRFRPLMLVGVLEKISFGLAAAVLYAQQRLALSALVFGMIDLSLAALVVVNWWKTANGEQLRATAND
jgi:hypothetical protein